MRAAPGVLSGGRSAFLGTGVLAHRLAFWGKDSKGSGNLAASGSHPTA